MNRLTIAVVVAAGCCVALASDDIPPPRLVDVAALVRQLGSEDFAERERATNRLSTLRVDEVPPELLAALKSDSPEVRDRAAKAIKALREHIALARLPRGERFARRGQIDLYIASTAASNYKADDARLWEPTLEVGRMAIRRAELTGDRLPACPSGDFAAFKKALNPRFTRVDEVYQPDAKIMCNAIHSPGVKCTWGCLYSVVLSRGPILAAKGAIQHSLILATGDVASGYDISCSVVVCDGDVRVGENVVKTLIIARGSITVEGWGHENTLIAGGKVTIKKPVPLNNGQQLPKELENLIEEHARHPLGYITFFELSVVGVEVKVADMAVRVSAVADGKPFAKAGVKVGDVVTEVNGKKPDSPEALRRLLRDALAVGDATVKLRRGDKAETVTISLPE
jgi:hypothetical protein